VSAVSLKAANTAVSTRVLLVEDDQVDRMAFERLVSKAQLRYDYSLASNLQDALAVLESTHFDIVISDYHLPDGTAIDLFRMQLDVPIIVITGAGDERIAVQAMRAGASDYLIKDLERNYLAILPITVENALRKQSLDRQLRMLSHAVENVNEALYICDPEGYITYVNSAFLSTYGYSREKILGSRRDRLWAAGSEVPAFPFGSTWDDARDQFEAVHRRGGGEEFPVLVSRSILKDLAGDDLAEVGVVWDITDRKRAEDALRDSEMRYALAARGANDGLWDWDLRTGHLYFSPRWKSMLGYGEEEVGSSLDDWLRLVHPEDVESLKAQLDAHIEGLTPHFESEHRIRHRNGSYRWTLARGLAVREPTGRPYRMAGSQTDVTDRKRAEQQLLHDALHDSLTGLPNRVLFQDRLSSALTRSKRRRSYLFAVLFLDLDRFKVINDSLGHLFGDELLVRVSRRLESCLRIGDTVARLGGDEFAILVDDTDREEDALEIAQRVQAEFLQPFELDGHEVFTSASIGIALSNVGYRRAEDLLRDADTAMYRAKARAENVPVVFDPEMHTSALLLLRLESDLRRALERDEFELHFQPIYRFPEGLLWGFESLLRWHHPKRGMISPEGYLPLAEETGLILPLGEWVLRQACRQAAVWRRLPGWRDLVFSVNVSGRQLTQRGFASMVSSTVRAAGLDARALHLEITEKVMIDQPEAVQQTLGELREQGIQLHIDDFGTGYSSLSQLHRFPVDKLKIDRIFVKGLGPGGESNEIVRTIIALAHALNLEVMAEGVETKDQLEMTRHLECEYAQGYLFSRALDSDEVEKFLMDPAASLPLDL
jgi:diguanylate cyclase (GGDEF)-like protein/PAS domain S-box-containing protein